MNDEIYDPKAYIEGVKGWLSADEADLLHKLAMKVPAGSNIVEIGSYQGRSTIMLAQGAISSQSVVYAIDPHDEKVQGGAEFGMRDMTPFLENLTRKSLFADTVRIINFPSIEFAAAWRKPIALLFIDGDHEEDAPMMDYMLYAPYVRDAKGKVAIHDSQGGWEKPTELVQHIVKSGQGRIVETANQLTVLELS